MFVVRQAWREPLNGQGTLGICTCSLQISSSLLACFALLMSSLLCSRWEFCAAVMLQCTSVLTELTAAAELSRNTHTMLAQIVMSSGQKGNLPLLHVFSTASSKVTIQGKFDQVI